MAWRDRPKHDRYGIIGIFIGMAISAVLVLLFAVESSMMVRYLIMAAGLVAGWGVGRWVGRTPASSSS